MKNILLTGLIAISIYSFGQSKCKTRLLLSSANINSKTNDTIQISSIRHALWSDSIIVKTDKKKKITYASKDIWGYQDDEFLNGCVMYRNFDDQFYKIRQIGSLIMYSQNTSSGKAVYSSYFFSKTLDSPIYSLKWKNIKEQFKDNTCFLEKLNKDLKWYQDYENIDKENGKYRFIEFYDSCK